MIDIGGKFEETKSKLMDRIWKGEIDALELNAEYHDCYFCGGHIEGGMQLLTVKEEDWDDHFYVGNGCYEMAKLFMGYYDIYTSLN